MMTLQPSRALSPFPLPLRSDDLGLGPLAIVGE